MTLIKSISGIRGTIGGHPGQNLTPEDIIKFTSAFADLMLSQKAPDKNAKVVIGRDARKSGFMISKLVTGTLLARGINVLDLGLSTTPTVEIAVINEKASGGIVITASHNPQQWNALKLLNASGEFLSEEDGRQIMDYIETIKPDYASVKSIGHYSTDNQYIDKHIEKILRLPLVDVATIEKAGFSVTVDCVNSTGGLAIPPLLEKLGVKRVDRIFCEPNGEFPHNPEPLPENLREISEAVVKNRSNVGFVVDPDVDRLAIILEDGEMFGEEYTLVAVADYILKNKKGNTVSNLSSTLALAEITEKAGGEYFASAVGEVNVVQMMKEKNAVIGGEGNGGVIYPELHHGRDALVGIALFLSHLAQSGMKCSALRNTYPNYFMSKNKIPLPDGYDADLILNKIAEKYKSQPVNRVDGVRIEFDRSWVHIRKSNTEPIIRIYAENDSITKSDILARKIIQDISDIIKDRI
jgi:phosphomannomutase